MWGFGFLSSASELVQIATRHARYNLSHNRMTAVAAVAVSTGAYVYNALTAGEEGALSASSSLPVHTQCQYRKDLLIKSYQKAGIE